MAELHTRGVKVEDFDTPGPTTEVLADEPSWTRKAARATLDSALEERECERALLKNGR
jgi:hypothetical protein